MANALTPLSPTYWSRIMGIKLYKKNVSFSIVSRREEAVLKDGQIVDRPYRADTYVEKYTKGTALTAQDITATSDQLTVDQIFAQLIYVDDVDKIQNKWDAASVWSEEAVIRLSNQIDASVLYAGAVNANDTVDANDLDSGETAGEGIVLTSANVLKMFTVTARKLSAQNVDLAKRFMIISPEVKEVLLTFLAGKESALGDRTGEAGNIGRYMGFQLYESNNLTGKARWTPVDDPANGATITINGITFTFVSTIGTTAGNVLIAGTAAGTIDNLVSLINNPSTTNANHVAFSGSNLAALQRGFVAVDGATYIEVRVKGSSYLTLATSEAADVWTTAHQKQLNLAGEKGAIDLVVQKRPSVKMASTVSAGKDGMNILSKALWGTKVFEDMKKRLLSVEVRSDSF